jgi:hypothetical protein
MNPHSTIRVYAFENQFVLCISRTTLLELKNKIANHLEQQRGLMVVNNPNADEVMILVNPKILDLTFFNDYLFYILYQLGYVGTSGYAWPSVKFNNYGEEYKLPESIKEETKYMRFDLIFEPIFGTLGIDPNQVDILKPKYRLRAFGDTELTQYPNGYFEIVYSGDVEDSIIVAIHNDLNDNYLTPNPDLHSSHTVNVSVSRRSTGFYSIKNPEFVFKKAASIMDRYLKRSGTGKKTEGEFEFLSILYLP